MKGWLRKIVLCIDNSEFSHHATGVTVALADAFKSSVTGVHGYNASMHEGAFRIMEPILPSQFQREEILTRQRTLHNKLINEGMEKISISYLRPLEEFFTSEGINFKVKVKEGKNFVALTQMIEEEGADLVVLGGAGFNSNGRGFIGSVCLRLLRKNNRDFLIVKTPLRLDQINSRRLRIVVCLDGSHSAVGALHKASLLAEKFIAELHLLYVFDSVLHKEVFTRLKDAVLSKEGFRFNKRQQEKMHDEFIDAGLEKVGKMILEKAEKQVASQWYDYNASDPVHGWGPVERGVLPEPPVVIKKVLEGYVYKRICEYAEEIKADLICIGRTGRHFTEDIDIGSVAENVVRFSPCSILVTRHEQYRPWEI